MGNLRETIAKATNLIKENPLDQLEEQLEKLKISYEREKQEINAFSKCITFRSWF